MPVMVLDRRNQQAGRVVGAKTRRAAFFANLECFFTSAAFEVHTGVPTSIYYTYLSYGIVV